MFRPRSLVIFAAALGLSAVAASPASADLGSSDCDNPVSSQVFAPWYDPSYYFLAPDGGFENGADGWALDGASVVPGNHSYGPGSSSLSLPGGASATSPAVCVGIEHPTFRFFVRRDGGSALSAVLRVEVVMADGSIDTLGVIGGTSSWDPSPITVIGANLLPLVTGGSSTDVSFRFTSLSGSWQIDDVYVDPRGNW